MSRELLTSWRRSLLKAREAQNIGPLHVNSFREIRQRIDLDTLVSFWLHFLVQNKPTCNAPVALSKNIKQF